MTALTLVETKGEARADSRLIAVELQNQHNSVMLLIDRYIDKFKGFGVVRFEIDKPTGTKGGRLALNNAAFGRKRADGRHPYNIF